VTQPEASEVRQYVEENRKMLTRMLAHGDAEARSYALALLSHEGTVEDIEAVQQMLDDIREQKA
jgi:hypothetical protein